MVSKPGQAGYYWKARDAEVAENAEPKVLQNAKEILDQQTVDAEVKTSHEGRP